MLVRFMILARRLFTRPRKPSPCRPSWAISLGFEWLEAREVPATLLWKPDAPNLPAPTDDLWSDRNNWVIAGQQPLARPAAAPGVNDTAKFEGFSVSTCDVLKVASVVTTNIDDLGPHIGLFTNLEVTNVFNADTITIYSDSPTNRRTLTMSGASAFVVGGFYFTTADLVFGSPTNHTVTSEFENTAFLENASITNYGDMVLQANIDQGVFVTTYSTVTNAAGGKANVKAHLLFSGNVVNAGELKLTMTAALGLATYSPTLLNSGTVRVYPGTAKFERWVTQTDGEFQLRDTTVRLASNQPLEKELFIGSGSLTGKGTIDGNVVLGHQNGAGNPSVSPGIDDLNAATIDTATISVTGTFVTNATAANVNLQVVSETVLDKIEVTGAATIAGTANITASADYKPAATTQLKLITSDVSLTGTFGTVNLTRNPWLWTTTNDGNAGRDHYWESAYFLDGKSFGIVVQLGPLQPPPPPPPPGP